MADWILRDETAADAAAIGILTTAAFAGHPYSIGTEAAIVEGLRESAALSVSLVAVDASGAIIGHVAFSPVTIGGEGQGWFGLGPLSVAPSCQRSGIGSALVTAGIARLRALGAKGCVLVGDLGYYSRFGFENDSAVTYAGLPPEYVMVLWLGEARAAGAVKFHPAFGV